MPWMQKGVPVGLLYSTVCYTWACCHSEMLIEWLFGVNGLNRFAVRSLCSKVLV